MDDFQAPELPTTTEYSEIHKSKAQLIPKVHGD